jgi:hypothetical protein
MVKEIIATIATAIFIATAPIRSSSMTNSLTLCGFAPGPTSVGVQLQDDAVLEAQFNLVPQNFILDYLGLTIAIQQFKNKSIAVNVG